ncbi:efflux RND transporter periplasmic adaptor subunit [Acinetobacter soli]|uniref:efflux RND transporter periplasmic adaptor subunit n=1 Tax=Acinetobacter soli TaxID=487316 RepID=UPI00125CA434|nr:efflux RND transporter periplasmic adaptor subunit [Acinetobacter soli]
MRSTLLVLSKATILSMSLMVAACSQKDAAESSQQSANTAAIELIGADLVAVKSGQIEQKTAFIGTIRAVNQSSVQAQVTATATQVNVNVGQSVTKGQILVRLDNQDNAARLSQARANLASTRAQADLAKNLMQRKKRLLDQGFISRVEYEQSEVDYKAQLETVNAQRANVDIAEKANLDGTIRSPLSGVITKRQVEPGQTVAAGSTLFEIVDPAQLEIQGKLPIEQQSALAVGKKISFNIQGERTVQEARLSRISPVADQVSRQIEFFAQPSSPIRSLSIGAFVEGFIYSQDQISGQIIPLNSIQSMDQQPYVWVVRQQKLHKVAIKLLEKRFTDDVAIVQGLQPGDRVSRIAFENSDDNKAVRISGN